MKLFSPKKTFPKKTRQVFSTAEECTDMTASPKLVSSPLKDISNTPTSSPSKVDSPKKGSSSKGTPSNLSPARQAINKLGKTLRRRFSVSLNPGKKFLDIDLGSNEPVVEQVHVEEKPMAESMPTIEEESTWTCEIAGFDELNKSGRNNKIDTTDEEITPRTVSLTNEVEYEMIPLEVSEQPPADYVPVKKVLLKKSSSVEESDDMKCEDFKTLSDCLRTAMLNDTTYSDVLIRCGQNLRNTFLAHRIILAYRSEYFKSILKNIDTNKVDRKDTLNFRFVIDKPYFSPDTFSQVLQYIYTGSIELNCENALDILELADDLRLGCLKKLCTKFLVHQMDAQNVCTIIQMSRKFHTPELTRAALVFIEKRENVISVLRSESLCDLTVDNLIGLIKRDNLPLKCEEEIEVFYAVVRWNKHKLQLKEKGENVESYDLNQIMKYIRFPLLRTDQLADICEVSGLVSQPLLFEAYRHHIVPLSKLSENKKKMGVDEDQGLSKKDRELKSKRFSQRVGLINPVDTGM